MTRPAQALETPNPTPAPTPAKIVESCPGLPPETAVKQGVHPRPRAVSTRLTAGRSPGCLDGASGDDLAAKYLPQFDLPTDTKPCEPEAMERWLERLDITVAEYRHATKLRSLQDFIDLNPGWSLRAWLQTVLEMRHEMSSTP